MAEQGDKARAFAALHRPGDPVVLYNAWDAGSAKAVAEAGAKAIATGSASVAAAHGFQDAKALPLELVLANAERVVRFGRPAGDDRFRGRLCGRAGSASPRTWRGWRRRARSAAISRTRWSAARAFTRSRCRRRGSGPPRGGRPRLLHQRPHRHLPQDQGGDPREAAIEDGARPRPRLCRGRARAASSCRASSISTSWRDLRGLAAAGQFHGLSRRAGSRRGRGGGRRPDQPRALPAQLAMKALKEAAEAIYG